MMAASLPTATVAWRTALTLLIAAVGGLGLDALHFPAGLVTGSLIAVAAAALAGWPVLLPEPLSRVILVLIGISIGAVITPETLKGLMAFPLAVALLLAATFAMIVVTSFYLRFVHGWDARSALFGASPGALSQIMALSAEYKADLRAIAIVQTIRVIALTVGIPIGLSLFGLTVSGGLMTRFSVMGPPSFAELAALVAISAAVAMVVAWLRLPGGLLFGAMVGSAALHGSGLIEATLPWWVAYAAVLGIGAIIGSRFANTSPRALLRFLGAALGSFAVAMSIAALAVLVLSSLMSVGTADAVVAFAPGAQDTMMVLALALHLDPVFVGAMHLSRFLLVSLLVPFLAHRMKRPGPPSGEDGTGR